MSFTFLSTAVVLGGIGVLAVLLGILQRLRVQHREIEVVSTLFWQAAVEETRARVFVKRFRHWPAWLLIVTIASCLWLLFAGPRWIGNESMQHVVLLDGSVTDSETRDADFVLATSHASGLPLMHREVVSAGSRLETLVRPGELVELGALRVNPDQSPGSTGLEWALDALASRASAERPMTIHVIGDVEIDARYLDALPAELSVYRIERGATEDRPLLQSLGLSNSASGNWQTVDVLFSPADSEGFDVGDLNITLSDKTIPVGIVSVGDGEYLIEEVPAMGGILRLKHKGNEIGAITLPQRERIKVAFENGTPEVLKQLVLLDPACIEAADSVDLVVGTSEDADLRLVSEEQSAFEIGSENGDAESALQELVAELSLRQIDANALAAESGRLIDVQVIANDRRRISLWKNLFTGKYNFLQSRAGPIFVARAIRWLAQQPKLVPWAEPGMRLPEARPVFERVTGDVATASDGRRFQATRLTRPTRSVGKVNESPRLNSFAGLGIGTWIGLLVVILLVTEWGLYQRGRMP